MTWSSCPVPSRRFRTCCGFTSADFALLVERDDGLLELLLGEWKYTEFYGNRSLRIAASGTEVAAVYAFLVVPFDK